jgi:deferrochelatase/peroxidase EfeB
LQDLPAVQVLKREDFAQEHGGRTPFGYKDGISFPNIQGNDLSPIVSPEEPIAAGEFVLGYPGDCRRSVEMPQPDILGRNGTFVGFRKLHSRVAAFRRFLRDNAAAPLTPEMLAAKMVGRWPSGAPLMLTPDADRPELGSDLKQMNNFLYGDDPKGLRCPLGSHVRRMNPRDTPLAVLDNVNLHRIIRHGNAYGPPLPEGAFEDDGQSRGIFFIFLSACAPETYEFLKKHWIEDGNFLGLETQRDPIAGSHDGSGTFTIPLRPVRRRIPMLESFTRTLGGEYAFMPGLRALRWLSELA